MKRFICLICATILFSSCESQSTGLEYSFDPITLSTDKGTYTKLDTINLNLKNNSDFDAVVGLRCGSFLEMFYQKKQDGDWSDNLWFWYMSLLCPTHLDTIEKNTTFEYSIPTEIIDSTGTFRLLVDVHILKRDTNVTVFSNTFKIE